MAPRILERMHNQNQRRPLTPMHWRGADPKPLKASCDHPGASDPFRSERIPVEDADPAARCVLMRRPGRTRLLEKRVLPERSFRSPLRFTGGSVRSATSRHIPGYHTISRGSVTSGVCPEEGGAGEDVKCNGSSCDWPGPVATLKTFPTVHSPPTPKIA